MKIEHLNLFVRLAAVDSITRAGAELGLSPAVASAYVNKLEEGLGVRLVHRTTRSVSLTEAGKAFLPHAEDVLASVDAARASVGAGGAAPAGTLRIAAPASFGRMHLVPALNDLLARYPGLSIDCRLSDAIVDMVEGGFDVAIRIAELQDSSLIARRVADDRRVLCAAPAYLQRFGEPEGPRDLAHHQCISLPGLDRWDFYSPDGVIRVRASGKLRVDNGEAVRDACVAGMGITVNSTWVASEQLRSGELIEVLPNYPLVSNIAIWAVYPSSRLLAPKVRAFIDHLVERFAGTPYWEQDLSRLNLTRSPGHRLAGAQGDRPRKTGPSP